MAEAEREGRRSLATTRNREPVEGRAREDESRRASVTSAATTPVSPPEEPRRPPLCSLCHVTEMTNESAAQCVECGKTMCRKCSMAIPSGKKHVWMCLYCAENYPQLAPTSSRPTPPSQEIQKEKVKLPREQTIDHRHHSESAQPMPQQHHRVSPVMNGSYREEEPVPPPRSLPDAAPTHHQLHQQQQKTQAPPVPCRETVQRSVQPNERPNIPMPAPRTKQLETASQVLIGRGEIQHIQGRVKLAEGAPQVLTSTPPSLARQENIVAVRKPRMEESGMFAEHETPAEVSQRINSVEYDSRAELSQHGSVGRPVAQDMMATDGISEIQKSHEPNNKKQDSRPRPELQTVCGTLDAQKDAFHKEGKEQKRDRSRSQNGVSYQEVPPTGSAEERRNDTVNGIIPPEPVHRRQLPIIDKNRHSVSDPTNRQKKPKQQQELQQHQQQQLLEQHHQIQQQQQILEQQQILLQQQKQQQQQQQPPIPQQRQPPPPPPQQPPQQPQQFQKQPQHLYSTESEGGAAGKASPSVKAMTSYIESTTYLESRNGQTSIPRTVPLTSLAQTLQQQQQQPREQQEEIVSSHYFTESDISIGGKEKAKPKPKEIEMPRSTAAAMVVDPTMQQFVQSNKIPYGQSLSQVGSENTTSDLNKEKIRSAAPPLPSQPAPPLQQQMPVHDLRKGKPKPPKDMEQYLEEYQDEEEEEDIDDYFQLIENAIGVRKPQVMLGLKRSSDIQKQLLMSKESSKDRKQNDYKSQQQQQVLQLQKGQVAVAARQIDLFNQQQLQQQQQQQQRMEQLSDKKTDKISSSRHQADSYGQHLLEDVMENSMEETNLYQPPQSLGSESAFDVKEDDFQSYKKGQKQQFIIQPQPDMYQRSPYGLHTIPEDYPRQKQISKSDSDTSYTGIPYDKLMLHQLTPDTRQPSAKHYLEEHKTQPISYEVFSSTKALQSQQKPADIIHSSSRDYVTQTKPAYVQPLGRENQKLPPIQQQHQIMASDVLQQKQTQGGSGYYYSQPPPPPDVAYQMAKPADGYDVENKTSSPLTPKTKPNTIDLQGQKKVKPKPDPQDWSPVSDLSPIMDVSPSIEAAEQELMEKFQEKTVIEDEDEDEDIKPLVQANIPRATSGTISGMLEEFNRALGLPGTSPVDDSGIKTAVSPTSLAISPISIGSSTTTITSLTLQKEYQEGFARGMMSPKQSQQPQQSQHGSPQKTLPQQQPSPQPGTPRRTHRRLPQPTMEQMQAAVAMAAKGPGERSFGQSSIFSTGGSTIVAEQSLPSSTSTPSSGMLSSTSPVTTSASMRPVSPMMPWKSKEMTHSFEQAYKHQMGTSRIPTHPTGVTTEIREHVITKPDVTLARHDAVPTSPRHYQSTSIRNLPTSAAQSVPTNQVQASMTTSTASVVLSMTSHSESDVTSTSVSAPLTPTTVTMSVSPLMATSVMESSATTTTTSSIQARRLKSYGDYRPPNAKMATDDVGRTFPGIPGGTLYVATSAAAEVATTEGSPQTPSTPRDKCGDSSDTQSEAESVKSVRLRRKLPTLPQDQRSSPSPTRKSLDRNRTPSTSSDLDLFAEKESTSYHSLTFEIDYPTPLSAASSSSSSIITTSVISTPTSSIATGITTGTSTTASITLTSTSTAESARLSPNPSLTSSQSRSLSPARSPSSLSTAGSAVSPSSSGKKIEVTTPATSVSSYLRSPSPLLGSDSGARILDSISPSGTKLPQYMQTLKQQLREELKAVTEERKVMMELRGKDRDRDVYPTQSETPEMPPMSLHHRLDDDITIMTTATTTIVSSATHRYDTMSSHRKLTHPTTSVSLLGTPMSNTITSGTLRRQQSPRASPQASPKKGRRRHTSEITMPPFSPIREDRDSEVPDASKMHPHLPIRHPPSYISHHLHHDPQQQQQGSTPFKSFEFESLDGHIRSTDVMMLRSSKYGGSLGSGLSTDAMYQRRIKPEIGFTGMVPDRKDDHRLMGPDAYFQTLNNEINRLRRTSEGSGEITYDKPNWERNSPQTTERRKRKEKKPRKPRSWHPSPYVSEDEDDQLTREEKKAKIKAEIARRRQQIEENSRLHEELVKLARRRDRADQMQMGNSPSYKPAPVEMLYSAPHPVDMATISRSQGTLGEPQGMVPSDTSSVLKAIDEILRKDLYSGTVPRTCWVAYNYAPRTALYTSAPSSYITLPRTRYEYAPAIKESLNWFSEHSSSSPTTQFPDNSAEDESIARIASTFPTDESAPPDLLMSTPCATFDPMCDFSPVTTDTETPTETDATPAMPLLPDMPTRSRKLLENLGSSPIVGQPARSSSGQGMYQERLEGDRPGPQNEPIAHRMVDTTTTILRPSRKSTRTPVSKTTQKYDFPVKRILLTRDPKDRSVSGNGLGMKVVGGKEVPGSNGVIGAYVAKIFPGGVVETLGEVKEGDQVLEWNGIPLTGRTYEEVQRIIASSADEVEIVIRCDLNMLEPESLGQQRRSPGLGMSGPGSSGSGMDPPDTPGSGARISGPSPAQSPYSPGGSSRGQSPALTKRMMGGGGGPGGGGTGGAGIAQGAPNGSSLSNTSSYDNLHSPDQEKQDYRLFNFTPSPLESVSTSSAPPIGQGESGVVTLFTSSGHPPPSWADLYTPTTPLSPSDVYTSDTYKDRWPTESCMEEVQLQVSCGTRAAIVYVPVIPVRPLVTVKNNGYVTEPFVDRSSLPRKSMDHLPDYHSLLKSSNPVWKTSGPNEPPVPVNGVQQRHLGVSLWNYDLLHPKNSLSKVSLYLDGLKEKQMPDLTSLYKLHGTNGVRQPRHLVEEMETRREESDRPAFSSANERPRAPQDLPGLKPVFVNDWKKPKKSKDDGNDNNNNNSSSNNNEKSSNTKKSKVPVGSSPEATPYNILPKGCRGSFCIVL